MRLKTFLAIALLGSVGAGPALAAEPPPVFKREQLNAVLWAQRAPEYRAVVTQTFAMASRALGLQRNARTSAAEDVTTFPRPGQSSAVLIDIDETTLDNSPYQAGLVQRGEPSTDASWEAWALGAKAQALPGVKAFVARALALKYRVVFVSNRACKGNQYDPQGLAIDCRIKQATLDNLERELGYRPAPEDVLLRGDKLNRDDRKGKQARRQEVAATHRIALLVGDDLNDFVLDSEYQEDTHAKHWGKTWFALPNAMYGSWKNPYPSLEAAYAGLQVWPADTASPTPAPAPRAAAAAGPAGPLSQAASPATPTAPAQALSVVSWNLEWLADPAALAAGGYWTRCAALDWAKSTKIADGLPFCDVYHKQTKPPAEWMSSAAEYESKKLKPLRASLARLAASGVDLLFVQEVAGPAALNAVLPAGYEIPAGCFTTRDDPQNVGLAVRTAARLAIRCKEYEPLSLEELPAAMGHPLRRGLDVAVTTAQGEIRLLAVHLKSGCPEGTLNPDIDACHRLQQQVPALEHWIEDRAKAQQPFMVLGDWNRNLEKEARAKKPARSDGSDPTTELTKESMRKVVRLLPELDDGAPPESGLDVVTVDRAAATVTHCQKTLDQVVVGRNLLPLLQTGSLTSDRHLRGRLIAGEPGDSDHCALGLSLSFN